jgi:uncharacterized protein (TIGR03435 family)
MARLSGAQAWDGPSRFDVEAKTENPSATHAELISMLQTLLADRFKLKFHRETKDVPGYALLVGKKRSQIQRSRAR